MERRPTRIAFDLRRNQSRTRRVADLDGSAAGVPVGVSGDRNGNHSDGRSSFVTVQPLCCFRFPLATAYILALSRLCPLQNCFRLSTMNTSPWGDTTRYWNGSNGTPRRCAPSCLADVNRCGRLSICPCTLRARNDSSSAKRRRRVAESFARTSGVQLAFIFIRCSAFPSGLL